MQLNVVAYGYNPWSSMWKRTQTLVAHLAKQDFVRETLFVNPRVDWSHFVTDRNSFAPGTPPRESLQFLRPSNAHPGVTAFTPVIGPWMYPGRPLHGIRSSWERSRIGPFLDRPYLFYANAVRYDDPLFWECFEGATARLFDWSDDFATFTDEPVGRRRLEEAIGRLVRDSDLVLAVNPALERRGRDLGGNAIHLRNGTDAVLMGRAMDPKTPVHAGLAELPRPVVGYMGFINVKRLDLELLERMARAHPQWSFAFVGLAVERGPLGPGLESLPNVHRFDAVPYQELPGVLKGFDVCMLPNRITEHTRGNDPIKLFDYLASGRPVVSTPTAGTEHLTDVLALADDADGFARAIERALEDDRTETREARLRVAAANSWERRGERMVSAVREVLAAREIVA